MERESKITKLTFTAKLLTIFENAKLLDQLPSVLIQCMHQIEIHIVLMQSLQLLMKDPVHILQRLYFPDRKLRSQIIGISGVTIQCLTGYRFTLSSMIRIRRVKIVHSGMICPIQHIQCQFFVDASVCIGRKTHTSKAKQRSFCSNVVHCSVFHLFFLLMFLYSVYNIAISFKIRCVRLIIKSASFSTNPYFLYFNTKLGVPLALNCNVFLYLSSNCGSFST